MNAHARIATPTLNLPQGVTITPTGLILPPDLPIADWKAIGMALQKAETGIQWWLGDWWHYGDHAYGDRKAQAAARKSLHYAFGTLMNYGWVAGKVAPSLRNELLSFNHHYMVARLEPVEQKRYLDRAVKGKWSVHKLRVQIQSNERNPELSDYERAQVRAIRLELAAEHARDLAYFNGLDTQDLELLSQNGCWSADIARLAEVVDVARFLWDHRYERIREFMIKAGIEPRPRVKDFMLIAAAKQKRRAARKRKRTAHPLN